MKTKKTVIAVLTVALLISAALIVGCLSPEDIISAKPEADTKSNEKAGDNYQIPAGKGVIRLKISDSSARTIIPDNPSATLATMKFRVIVTGKTINTTPVPYPSSSTLFDGTSDNDIEDPIALDADDYDISILAYDSTGLIQIAGWDSGAGSYKVEVKDSEDTEITANLIGLTTSSAVGTFSYSITIPVSPTDPADYTVHSLAIFNYSGGSAATTTPSNPVTIDADGTTQTGSLTLKAGYYIVKLTVSLTNYQTRQYVRALHIYPAMTSTMDTIVVPALVKVKGFTVAYNLGTISSTAVQDTGPSGSGNNYGTLSNKDYGFTIPGFTNDPVATNFPTYNFDGWYKGPNGTGGKYVFSGATANNFVLADTTLYANWIQPGPGSVSFTVTFNYSDLMAGANTNKNISRGNFGGGNSITLTLGTPPDNGKWDNIVWYSGDIDYSSSPYDDFIDTDTYDDDTLYINNSAAYHSLLSSGFEVTVTADLVDREDALHNSLPDQIGLSCTVNITVTD